MTRNIALVGCGAIAQVSYLPALVAQRNKFDRIWLVDTNEVALQKAVSMVNGEPVSALSDVFADLDFVIIATPSESHFTIAIEALARGSHVLIEKPFVLYPDEGSKLVAKSAECRRIVAVNQTRRFFPCARDLRQRLGTGEFGRLLSIKHREGMKSNWPYQSGAAFAKDAQRTGVIMDTGVHAIDFYQYLLEPEWTIVSAMHDGFAGPEGLANIELTANGAPVTLGFSRYEQKNRAQLSFERAVVSIGIFDWSSYTLQDKSGNVKQVTSRNATPNLNALGEMLLSNFIATAEGREKAVCDAASSLPVINVLDEIYWKAQLYPSRLGFV